MIMIDVWFKNTHCPRCVLPKKTLSQMSCSKIAIVIVMF